MWQHASAGGVLFPVVYLDAIRADGTRLFTGSPPARPTSRSEWTWTVSSTWLKYLGPGPGEGASLKGGSCALSWHNRSVEACLIVEGAPPA